MPRINEEMPPSEMEALHLEVEAMIARADFKRADSLLRDANRKQLTSAQSAEIRRLGYSLRETSFLHHQPLEVRIWTPQNLYTFSDAIPLYFEIFNLSDQALIIPAPGSLSWLPWGEKRKSLVLGEVELTDISIDSGTHCKGRWNPLLEFEETWKIDAGSSKRLVHELNLTPSKETLYRRLEIHADLIPGGLQTGLFDWGPIRLAFSPLIIHVIQEADLSIAEDPEAHFDSGLEALDVRRIFLGFLFMDDNRLWQAVDSIISILPELRLEGSRVIIDSLKWRTGENFGYDVHRWMNWWEVNRKNRLEPAPVPGLSLSPGFCLARLFPAFVFGMLRSSTDERKPFMGKGNTPPELDQTSIRDGLNDPYYGRRFAVLRKLQASGAAGLPVLKALLEDTSPRVRRGAVEALCSLEGHEIWGILLQALENENDLSVRQQIAQALGLTRPRDREEDIPALIEADVRLKEIFIERALMAALEEIMHFGSIPGFYDGQFTTLWSIAPDVFQYLVALALDPDLSFQIRVLAIMALHEKKAPRMIKALLPLIMDPKVELMREEAEFIRFRFDEDLILQHRERNLSKYARFSLAKAGYTQFNMAKIKVMVEWLQRNGPKVFSDPFRHMNQRIKFVPDRSFAKTVILDIGYNYQQFDQFDMAERWYKKLLDNFSDEEDFGLIAEAHYNLSCLYSITGRLDLSIKYLQLSVDKGFMDLSWMDRDRDLDHIRSLPEYGAIRDSIINRPNDDVNSDKVEIKK